MKLFFVFLFLCFGPIVLFRSYASHRVYGVYSNARALGSILGPALKHCLLSLFSDYERGH